MIIYDIREQKSPKEFVLIIFGIIAIIIATLLLIRVIYFLSGQISLNKVEILLNVIGVIGGLLIAIILITINFHTINDFKQYNHQIDANTCYSISGKPENLETYNIRSLDEDLIKFQIDGERFDTYYLYRTNNLGLDCNDVKLIKEADALTIKYVEEISPFEHETYNWILSIEVLE